VSRPKKKKAVVLKTKTVINHTEQQMLNEAGAAYQLSPVNSTEELHPVLEKRLIQSIKQARLGKTISNKDVMKLAKGWLSK
jgi:hypothetical protein